jgi:hypothetical protein
MASPWFFVIRSARPGPVAFGSIRSVATPGKMARQVPACVLAAVMMVVAAGIAIWAHFHPVRMS